jgi:hypothetical protein
MVGKKSAVNGEFGSNSVTLKPTLNLIRQQLSDSLTFQLRYIFDLPLDNLRVVSAISE